MKFKKKTNNKILTVIGVILVATLVLSLFGVFKQDVGEWEKVHVTWEANSLDNSGNTTDLKSDVVSGFINVKDTNSVRVALSPTQQLNFKVLCYDADENYLGYATAGIRTETCTILFSDIPDFGEDVAYIRIMIVLDEHEVSFTEVLKYGSYIDVYAMVTEE